MQRQKGKRYDVRVTYHSTAWKTLLSRVGRFFSLFSLYYLRQMVCGAHGGDVRRGEETEHTSRKTRAEEQQIQHHQQRHASHHANQTGEITSKCET